MTSQKIENDGKMKENDMTSTLVVTSVDMTVLGTQVFVQEKHNFRTITQLQRKSKSKTFNKTVLIKTNRSHIGVR